MEVINVGKVRRFLREKPIRVNLFDRPRMFCEVICLEPEQQETRHSHDLSDAFYMVVEGQGHLNAGTQAHDLEEQDLVMVPPGVEHSLRNPGPGRLTVLAMLAPKPARASEVRMPRLRWSPPVESEQEETRPPSTTAPSRFSRPSPAAPRGPRPPRRDDSQSRDRRPPTSRGRPPAGPRPPTGPRPARSGGSSFDRDRTERDAPSGRGRPPASRSEGPGTRTGRPTGRPTGPRRPGAGGGPFNRDQRPGGRRPAGSGTRPPSGPRRNDNQGRAPRSSTRPRPE